MASSDRYAAQFLCRSVEPNNGIVRVHLTRDSVVDGPEEILLVNAKTNVFLPGKSYAVEISRLHIGGAT
jgi:hypothetical protein